MQEKMHGTSSLCKDQQREQELAEKCRVDCARM